MNGNGTAAEHMIERATERAAGRPVGRTTGQTSGWADGRTCARACSRVWSGVVRRVVAACGLGLLVGAVTPACGADSGRATQRPPAPSLDGARGWLGTDRALSLERDLRGHVVLLDFWTYCCINCIHVLPDLEYLEEKYKDEPFVVVGVHSAKFDAEGEIENIRQAMLRYDIKHPVAVDSDFAIWRRYGARAWPTFVLIDAEGRVVGQVAGEGHRELLDEAVGELLAEARADGTLAAAKIRIRPEAMESDERTLRFPGKVLAVGREESGALAGGRVFIADSSHDRVIEATWPDASGRSEVVRVFGDGSRGLIDGVPSFTAWKRPGPDEPAARFHDPQGMSLDPESGVLYVADMKNHAVRAIDLASGAVRTIAGTGEQGRDRAGGKAGTEQALASPWAVAFDAKRNTLHIAMAGTHQLWAMDLGLRVVRATLGSGAENVNDAPGLLAALAQPSGLCLSSDGDTLYFTDTEGSSVRAIEIDSGEVRTLIGRAVEDPRRDSSLFDFGDIDGEYPDARLQHAIGIALRRTGEGDRLVIADTYNDKLKVIDPGRRRVTTWTLPEGVALDEPAGVSVAGAGEGERVFVADTNNHRVVIVDVGSGRATPMELVWPGVADATAAGGARPATE